MTTNSTRSYFRVLLPLGLLAIAALGILWFAMRGQESASGRRAVEPQGPEARPKSEATSNVADPANPQVLLWGLENLLQEYDQGPNWHVAQRLMIEYIKVDMDSKGRSEIVTPATAGQPFPPYDPNAGFFAATDPRGDRRYRFTREDYPEWFELISPPSGDNITGQQDGPAEFGKLSPELAGRIRTLASAAIELNRGQ